MQESDDYDYVLSKLQAYIQGDGHLLDWDTVDLVESLPYYIETDTFICVYAGLTLDSEGRVPPICDLKKEDLLYNRRFKNPEILPRESKCVFYVHTATAGVNSAVVS